MSHAILTLVGMYQYDNTLFDSLTIPDGIDRDALINNILLESGEFSVLYPNIPFMKSQIGYFSKKYYRTMEKWINALNFDYEPLYNYDRYEEWTDGGTSSLTSDEGIDVSTSTGNTTTDDLDATVDNNISAYDSATLQPDTQSVTDSYETVGSDTESTSSTTSNRTDSTEHETSHSGHLYGNIGVTTSQQMLESELSVSEWNIIQHITDIFLNEFCVMVY